MINTKRVLLIIFLILIPTVTIVSTVQIFLKSKEDIKGVSTSQKECTPYITNMMPNIAYIGEEYSFFPKIVGCDVEDISIELRGVDWLGITEGGYVSGIPSNYDIGFHRVVLVVRSASHSTSYVEYISVEEK